MSTARFSVKTHRFAGQHIREFAGATRHSEEDAQFLEAKQYSPLSNPLPQVGDITILGTHAMSFPKEMYEPLWDDLLDQCTRHQIRIRSVWTIDASNSGASGVLNEHTQGDDPSFFDYSRDLLHMINVFRDQMPQPIVGIGHSMGASALMQLTLYHPRVLASLILYDPVLGPDLQQSGSTLLFASSVRPDLWPTLEAAENAYKSVKGTQKWDPRVRELWSKHGLRDTPTLLHPGPGKVTLTTTKANESWSYARSWFDPLLNGGVNVTPSVKAKYPDHHTHVPETHPFYYALQTYVWYDLPRIRPGVKYVFPGLYPVTTKEVMKEIVKRTGVGDGGSGGVEAGRVEQALVKDGSHLLCFEKPNACAVIAAEWLAKDMETWQERRKFERENRDDKSINQLGLSEEWIRRARLYFEKVRAAGRSQAEKTEPKDKAKL